MLKVHTINICILEQSFIWSIFIDIITQVVLFVLSVVWPMLSNKWCIFHLKIFQVSKQDVSTSEDHKLKQNDNLSGYLLLTVNNKFTLPFSTS